ncbi:MULTISPECIES: aspartate carbamoyltransferase catalytic subunit [unclassified Sporosarcina]|uniref:aspartate carbamoyltransferase catalytic subunit n=1 Tax=unclassified Sporosarcina TaxID=2647733 RepID=UPI000C1708B8|nr:MULTISPECIES: aspartate carbamoyltransferase catalytic subunit [unclassified Sporosarcina]PID00106.1 aspartate carbamoyltransferase [Sporosarcina sp. P29]PID06788.1 aspartate carbamoyltransferase [Sporosarcina sp. P30]PID09983.1 aspartate carbamoyltransferase [Sporosarcina sp. P31]PID13562.1 aspartate carbamoyltransferase [Sporosarcina sp. P32b]
MEHLVSMKDLTVEEIMLILDRAAIFKRLGFRELPGTYTVCNLFFEPSTRTKTSFEMAERKVGAQIIPFETSFSSTLKGESLYDTIRTLEAIGLDALVIRHPADGFYEELIKRTNVAIINAGDGSGQHPTQSLLDIFTIQEEFGHFEGLKVLIAGDIAHSRVARSNAEALRKLGAEVTFLCPPEWAGEFDSVDNWDEVIETSDVVMLLRVQHERHNTEMAYTKAAYHEQYGLTIERAARMKKGAIIMHPAPVNRDVEIADSLIESPQSRIFKQVENGVYIRAAVLELILKGRK